MVIPVVEAASLTNFAGYVVWCAWLLAVAAVLFRVPVTDDLSTTGDRGRTDVGARDAARAHRKS